MKKYGVIIGTLSLLVFFQNCQRSVEFGSDAMNGAVLMGGDLTPVATDDGQEDAVVTANPNDPPVFPPVDEGENETEDPSTQPQPPTVTANENHPTPPHGGGRTDGEHGNNGNDNTEEESPTGEFVCILDGPGKSVKLGLIDGDLQGKNAVPSVVCMTERACGQIVARAFAVKSAEKRGYCKIDSGNPNVIHMTDAQLEAKVP